MAKETTQSFCNHQPVSTSTPPQFVKDPDDPVEFMISRQQDCSIVGLELPRSVHHIASFLVTLHHQEPPGAYRRPLMHVLSTSPLGEIRKKGMSDLRVSHAGRWRAYNVGSGRVYTMIDKLIVVFRPDRAVDSDVCVDSFPLIYGNSSHCVIKGSYLHKLLGPFDLNHTPLLPTISLTQILTPFRWIVR